VLTDTQIVMNAIRLKQLLP